MQDHSVGLAVFLLSHNRCAAFTNIIGEESGSRRSKKKEILASSPPDSLEVLVFSGHQCLTFHTNKHSPLTRPRRKRIKKETQINSVSI